MRDEAQPNGSSFLLHPSRGWETLLMNSETSGLPKGGPLLIGWQEYLDFPEWGLKRVRVKIDTGACTSALDAASHEIVEVPGGGLLARLRLVLNPRRPAEVALVE